MKYILGLDIGIASVGWAVLNLDRNRIEDLGVRTFSAAEDPKTKAPLAEPRRLARSARRRLRRRAGRLKRMKEVFLQYGLITPETVDDAFISASEKPSPWQIRAEGLDRILFGEELARALFHIAKRRGYKSNRKLNGKDSETGRVLTGISENRRILEENGFRTVGEMFSQYDKFQERKRNTTGCYNQCVERTMLEDEIKALFASQRGLGSQYASPEFEKQYLEIFNWQLPFASGEAILSKVGCCTFLKTEKRGARNSYTAERFKLLSDINKLSWYQDGEKRQLSPEQRSLVEKLAYQKCELKYEKLRKELKLSEEARFTALTYSRPKDGEDTTCEKAFFCKLSGFKEIRRISETAGVWDVVMQNPDLMDDIAYALTFYKTEDDIRNYLAERNAPERLIPEAANSAGFSKVINLSIKAMRNILPYLETGDVYSVACEHAGYDHSNPTAGSEKATKLPPVTLETTRNPVVLRALAQARKVFNAVVDRYGAPHHINIEMGRDVGRRIDERKKISRNIEENRNARQRDDEHFKEIYGMDPRNSEDRLKWKLYREQNGKCAYSLKPIDLENRFFEPGYVEIDHILPYSRSFDDRMSNKVLVLSSENQNKGNQTPYEYFGQHDKDRWNVFEAWVTSNLRDRKKQRNLLLMEYTEEERTDWIPRNLVDTQYIASDFSKFVRENLKFADENEKLPVVCLNGRITGLLRGLWGLAKVREENDLHHAMDAVVIASVTPHMIKIVTEYRKVRESTRWSPGDTFIDPETGEVIEFKFSFPMPWKGFRKELTARLSDDPATEIKNLGLQSYSDEPKIKPIHVSRKPVRKVTGPIHKETIRSIREQEGKRVAVIRTDITSLKKADLDKLYAPETNEKLYSLIKERMAQYEWNAKKAFEEPLHKPTNDGSVGPVVRKVKLAETQPSGVEVRGGIADNGSMVRVDVFTKDGKYYLVPVYTVDFSMGILPNKAITQGKPWQEWPEMDESYGFLFSLYPYDLIRIQTKKEEFLGYYRGCHRSTGALSICLPNKGDELIEGIGARTALLIEKYEVGILGDYYKVGKEKRRGLEDYSNIESSDTED